MRTADHMNLSRYIMDQMGVGALGLNKALFIFGSIEPDINMLTYLRGSIRGEEKLRGHNYENARMYMEKLTKKLERGGMGSLRQSFVLGKLVHYVADSFTYPHNSIFPGNLREHCQYETELHSYVNKMIEDGNVDMSKLDADEDITAYLGNMHDSYVEAVPGPDTDYRFITRAISMVTERFWQTDEVTVPAVQTVALACKERIPVPANVSITASGDSGMDVHTQVA